MDTPATADDAAGADRPAVSIILPTYNRARFLPQAFEATRGQQFEDWELIVVDDGSTDDTRALVATLGRGWVRPVRYVYQENRGAYGARNTGLDRARGEYVAFYDSDDVWLPHHLRDCIGALEANPDVDWVYGASRIVDDATGRTLEPNTFYVRGRPRPFLKLYGRRSGPLTVIEDPDALRCAIAWGLFCGLQCSVARRRVFERARFSLQPRNEAEDRMFAIRALASGCRMAYLDAVHVAYCVHDHNSSAAGADFDRTVRVIGELIAGYEALGRQVRLSGVESRALRKRLSREYFWCLGYQLWQRPARRVEALDMYRRALRLWPWDWRYWKTYLLARARAGRCPPPAPAG